VENTLSNKKKAERPEGASSHSDNDVLKPLNFRVPTSFHRAFKVYAAESGISMVELLEKSFLAYANKKN
jgi:predicted HicB family RNase H-like nuclease